MFFVVFLEYILGTYFVMLFVMFLKVFLKFIFGCLLKIKKKLEYFLKIFRIFEKQANPNGVEGNVEALEQCDQAHDEEHMQYVPSELVGCPGNESETLYHCYQIALQPDFSCNTMPHDILLATRARLEFDDETLNFELDVPRGSLKIRMKYVRRIKLASEEVVLCQKFQVTLLRLLLDHNQNKLKEALSGLNRNSQRDVFDYLLIPSTSPHENPSIDWKCVSSVLFPQGNMSDKHMHGCSNRVQVHTINGLICRCTLQNSLVVTPHDGFMYCTTGILDDPNSRKRRGSITYKPNFAKRHGITLRFEGEPFLCGQRLFKVQNCLLGCRNQETKGSRKASVELPPELCKVIMSPISIGSVSSFAYAPSIIQRIESFLTAGNLKRMLMDDCKLNDMIPTIKVLEAITTKNCRENFHLTSLATIGDSFLKYATSQQLFKTHQNHNNGLLTEERTKIVSNLALCKLGCDKKISGFIRNECFDPKTWIIPGDNSQTYTLRKEVLSTRIIVYAREKRTIKNKTVADVIEALIGVFICTTSERAALAFMKWMGFEVDFVYVQYKRPVAANPEKLVDLRFFKSLLNQYSFRDASLLVEALTHGSYVRPESPTSYEHLEFLGDAVLDYLITKHFHNEHPNLSSGLLTDLRSASVNNDCCARTAIRAGLHKHILHDSQDLQRRILAIAENFEQSSRDSTFGWESEPVIKILADIIKSLAGAIYVDSGYDKGVVFQSIKPLLEPLPTPETLKLQPVRELEEFCAKQHFDMNKSVTYENGEVSVKLEVHANGATHICQESAANKDAAEKKASLAMLEMLKGKFVKEEEDGKLKANANGVPCARRPTAANKKTARKTASMDILSKLKKN
nr:endoribonuclease Dicer homolog 2-like isoform X1 [Coffea arabica]XP_027105511.1 endoribonuclease Dicer homolog 2-like isoform X1 [Coffea arabica]XP_027105512.1 endoribonuclease Dicer homolog 2-like isoform X1 [Coffea arabica]XP_027105513.1 endoribonuclease Dicer homolog 2-like isoform X1 [Coffea arabica]